ncbi:tyrosine phosphatase-like protein [Lipomyces orientalis]|uniref:Tyrosine phosphatase-like protein n=1 Tax=Lipomyces orientalis TaxID=1233043 RepID=A0ACC3TQ90_9ASCO
MDGNRSMKPGRTSPTASTTSPTIPTHSSPRKKLSVKNFYLLEYNVISAFFWGAVLLRVILILYLLGPENVAEGNGDFTKWVQTGALLEVVHSVVGFVRSPVMTTVIQVASRILLVWGVVYLFPESGATTIAYSTMLLSWSVTEIIRYAFYAYSIQGNTPQWLTWLRYNTFFVLYPTGVASELLVIYASLGDATKFSEHYALLLKVIMVIYVPGFYTMFSHMLKQRRRVLKNLGKRREE